MLKSKMIPLFFLLASFCFLVQGKAPYEHVFESREEYTLPELDFELDELEPYLSEDTLKAHYLGHHATYTTKMNDALKQLKEKSSIDFSKVTLFQVLNYLELFPAEFKTGIKNNAGGYVNHAFYWSIMSPNKERRLRTPCDALAREFEENFGSFSNFKEIFSNESTKLFGSGYVWLVLDISEREDSFKIISLPNQDSPISINFFPILVIDIWEHAYYLDHKFKRPDYITDYWFLVDWQKVKDLRSFWKSYLATHDFNDKPEF